MNQKSTGQSNESGDVAALVLHPADDVATALRDLKAHERVWVQCVDTKLEFEVIENIPLCHKFALRPLALGEAVTKYGETIGVMTSSTPVGAHVHIQNLKSARAVLL